MADKYTNKSGSDSNTGADHLNAYLTVQKNVDEVGSGDDSYIGFGEYDENLLMPATKGVNIICDNATILKVSSGELFDRTGFAYRHIVRNAYIQATALWDGTTFERFVEFRNCVVDAEWNAAQARGETGSPYLFQDTVFVDDITLYWGRITDPDQMQFENCTILGNFELDHVYGSVGFYGHFYNIAFGGSFTLTEALTGQNYTFEHCAMPSTLSINGVSYAFDEAVAAYPTYLINCFEVADITAYMDDNYCPTPGSPLIDNGKAGAYADYVGARKPANNYDIASELFVGATYSNTEYSTLYGGVVLSAGATTGTVTTNVLRLGASQTIRELFLDVTQSLPTDVVDYDNTNSPNTLTFRYRISTTSEADCLAQSWTEVENWEEDLFQNSHGSEWDDFEIEDEEYDEYDEDYIW